jgi:hypothetical protein
MEQNPDLEIEHPLVPYVRLLSKFPVVLKEEWVY